MAREKKICESKEKSIKEYEEYIRNHINNVGIAISTFGQQLLTIANDSRSGVNRVPYSQEMLNMLAINHDASKFSHEEFDPYLENFHPYKGSTKSKEEIEEEFERAWTHHYTNNAHHPEYWKVNINGTDELLKMTNLSFVEMICDWVAMSMNFKESTYTWWKNNKEKKSKVLLKEDVELLDTIMENFKDQFDFSE